MSHWLRYTEDNLNYIELFQIGPEISRKQIWKLTFSLLIKKKSTLIQSTENSVAK